MIVAAVILSGTLPGMAAFQDVNGAVKGIPVFGDVKLTYPALIEWLGQLGDPAINAALASRQ